MRVRACVRVRTKEEGIEMSGCPKTKKTRAAAASYGNIYDPCTLIRKETTPPARTVMSNGQYHAPRGPYSHTEVCVDRTPIMHVYHIEQRARGTSLSRSVGLHGLLPKQVSNHPNVLKSAAATAVAAEVAYWWYVRQANPCPRKHLSHLWHYKRL